MAGHSVSTTDPLALLRGIERKARSIDIELPRQEEMQGYWNGVVFGVEGQKLALATSDMAEILTVPQCTRIPGTKPWVKGVANVRGTLLPILDLREFLVPAVDDRTYTEASAIVIDYEGYHVGLVVDEVFGMRHIPEEQVSDSPPGDVPQWLAAFLSGHAYFGNETYTIFSIDALVASAEFLDVAA